MDELGKIKIGMNRFCGPSVVAALTGLNTDEAAMLFTKVTGRKVITSVMVEEIEKVLNLCGIQSHEAHIWRNSTIFSFISDKMRNGSYGRYITLLEKHVILLELQASGVQILDNHTVEPLNISSSARLGEIVIHCRKVYEHDKKSVEDIRKEFFPEPVRRQLIEKAKKKPITSFILKKQCPKCGADAVEVSRSEFLGQVTIKLQCGHTMQESQMGSTDAAYQQTATNGKDKLMPFQIKGVQFAETSNVRCLIGDEQGLGKTVQALYTLKLHREELFPVVGAVKTTLTHQWFHQFRNWVGKDLLIQILKTGKDVALPGFDVYLISYDLLDAKDFFAEVDYKTVIFDECQMIKNHLALRSKASQRLAAGAEHIIALSGTAIKNNAGEYFTILNILQPGRFPYYDKYIRDYCDSVDAKIGGLKNPKKFHELTEDFIVRRTKTEVFPDLPPTQRNFFHVELDKRFNKAYQDAMIELDELLYGDDNDDGMMNMHILAIMTKMRRIAGLSKTMECVEFVEDFLDSCDRPIIIFAHHHDVVDVVLGKLNELLKSKGMAEVLNLTSDVKDFRREDMLNKFITGKNRVMIASTLSAGEGLDGLQKVCSDMVILERQWNPANEEQVEGRLDRRIGQSRKVNITYMIVSETIDEYFAELVEIKRSIVGSTLDNKEIEWNQSSLLMELAKVISAKGGKKWSIQNITGGSSKTKTAKKKVSK